MRAGELARCNADRLAHALQAAMNGSLLNWAIHRQGTVQSWIRRDLETVLAPTRSGEVSQEAEAGTAGPSFSLCDGWTGATAEGAVWCDVTVRKVRFSLECDGPMPPAPNSGRARSGARTRARDT